MAPTIDVFPAYPARSSFPICSQPRRSS